jgi:hypothetical protein
MKKRILGKSALAHPALEDLDKPANARFRQHIRAYSSHALGLTVPATMLARADEVIE